MKKSEYIDLAVAEIRSKEKKLIIRQELEGHIADRMEYYLDCGLSPEQAEEKAIERMGDAKTLSETISNLHNSNGYRNASLVFSALYGVGIVAGSVLTFMLFARTINLDEWLWGAIVCFASVAVFFFAAMSFRFAHKSQDEIPLFVNGALGIINMIVAPLTFVPCGYSALSLFFEYPAVMLKGAEFDYFYWPFETTIFGLFDIYDIFSTVLWIIMCLFAFSSLVSGILSLVTASHIINEKYENINEAFLKKIKKYSKMLLIISIIAAVSISVEFAITESIKNTVKKNNEKEQLLYIQQALEVFDKIEVPCDEKTALSYVTDESLNNDTDYQEFGYLCVYKNDGCEIVIYENSATETLGESGKDDYDGEFDEKRVYLNGIATKKQIEELRQLNEKITLEEFFERYPRENCETIQVCECSDGELVYVSLCFTDYDGYRSSSVELCFEDGVFDSVTSNEYEDYL